MTPPVTLPVRAVTSCAPWPLPMPLVDRSSVAVTPAPLSKCSTTEALAAEAPPNATAAATPRILESFMFSPLNVAPERRNWWMVSHIGHE